MHDGQLTITAARTELPAGAKEDDITASYDKGILTVSAAEAVSVANTASAEKCIPVDVEAAKSTIRPDGPGEVSRHSQDGFDS